MAEAIAAEDTRDDVAYDRRHAQIEGLRRLFGVAGESARAPVYYFWGQVAMGLWSVFHVHHVNFSYAQLREEATWIVPVTLLLQLSHLGFLLWIGVRTRCHPHRLRERAGMQIAALIVAVGAIGCVVPVWSWLPLTIGLGGLGAIELRPRGRLTDYRTVTLLMAIALIIGTTVAVVLYRNYGLEIGPPWRLGYAVGVRVVSVASMLYLLHLVAARQYRVLRDINYFFNVLECGIDIITEDHDVIYANKWHYDRLRPGASVVGTKCFRAFKQEDRECDPCTLTDALNSDTGTFTRPEEVGEEHFTVRAQRLSQRLDGKLVGVEVVEPLAEAVAASQRAVDSDRRVLAHKLRGGFARCDRPIRKLLGHAQTEAQKTEILTLWDILQELPQLLTEWLSAPVPTLFPVEVSLSEVKSRISRLAEVSPALVANRRVTVNVKHTEGRTRACMSSLVRTFEELFENYIKYSDAGECCVEMEMDTERRRVRYFVTQPGDPVPEEDTAGLFDPAIRGSRSDRESGEGKGLSDVRARLRQVACDLWYDADDERFVVELPLLRSREDD